jgi:hypothetical protein
MPDCIEFRMNEELIGRLIVAKRKGLDGVSVNDNRNENCMIQSTILPDIKFESFEEWFKYIHAQSARCELEKIAEKEMKSKMKLNLNYYGDWVNEKFLQVQ